MLLPVKFLFHCLYFCLVLFGMLHEPYANLNPEVVLCNYCANGPICLSIQRRKWMKRQRKMFVHVPYCKRVAVYSRPSFWEDDGICRKHLAHGNTIICKTMLSEVVCVCSRAFLCNRAWRWSCMCLLAVSIFYF